MSSSLFDLRQSSIDLATLGRVSTVWAVPEGYQAGGAALILAHGAGGDMHNPFLSMVHKGLAAAGVLTVKFNFPYSEAGRRLPDRMARLEATWRAVAEQVRDHPHWSPGRLFLGGKSMGGRVASHLAAGGLACEGLVFLGYPLHPAGKPERLRDEHLERIGCRMLFVQGSRDPLCRLELLRPILTRLGDRAGLRVIEGGDHSFRLPKRLGRSEPEVWAEIVAAIEDWVGPG